MHLLLENFSFLEQDLVKDNQYLAFAMAALETSNKRVVLVQLVMNKPLNCSHQFLAT